MTTKSKKSTKPKVESTETKDDSNKVESSSTESYKKPTRYNSSNIGELIDVSEFNARGKDFLCKRLNGLYGAEVYSLICDYNNGKLSGIGSELEGLLGFRDGDLRKGSGVLMLLLGRRCTLGGSGVGVGSRSFDDSEVSIMEEFCTLHELYFYGGSRRTARVAADLVAPITGEIGTDEEGIG